MEVLGEFIVNVHHLGSTAVPGLASRPMIDIAVESTVRSPGSIIIDVLRRLDYVPMREERSRYEYRFQKKSDLGFCLYWHQLGGSEMENQLRFRNWLRNRRDVRMKYEDLKRSLMREYCYDESAYNRYKAAVIEAMMIPIDEAQ